MDSCKICKKEFMRKYPRTGKRKIYCSKKCRFQDAYSSRTCQTCGKIYKKNLLSRRSPLYCSVACTHRYPCQLCGKIITGRVTFQGGEKRYCGRLCANFVNRTLKSKLSYMAKGFAKSLKENGIIKCNCCGIEDITALVVHHLDRNRLNNDLENLETLCANCHHRIHWGGGEKRLKCVQLAYMIDKYT